jgi:DNA-binding transcriptional LysR family regulator
MPLELDTALLSSFLALAETQNFTRAAERVGRTQSALSLQIKRLEDLLGKPLFVRGTRLATLTAEGEIFIAYARDILRLKEEAISRFREPDAKGEVRFGSPEDFATVFLPQVLSRFVASHPKILLNVQCDLTLNLLEGFRRGEYDLVLLKQSTPGEYGEGITVWKESLVWAAGGDHARKFAREDGQSAGDGLPLVLSPKPCVYRQRALEALEREGQRWRIVYTSPSLAGTVAAVKAGLGITVLPQKMLLEGLVPLRRAHLPDLKETHISLLTRNDAPPAVASLARYIAGHIG